MPQLSCNAVASSLVLLLAENTSSFRVPKRTVCRSLHVERFALQYQAGTDSSVAAALNSNIWQCRSGIIDEYLLYGAVIQSVHMAPLSL